MGRPIILGERNEVGACYCALKLCLPCIIEGSLVEKLSEIDRGTYGRDE